jgi:hypothetical protein
MKKTIRNNKSKNEILKYLKDFKNHSIRDISKDKDIDLDLCFVSSDDLEKKEYISVMNTTTRDGDCLNITITRKGSLFLKDGGYPSSGIRMTINAIKTHKATIISVMALIISLLAYLKAK